MPKSVASMQIIVPAIILLSGLWVGSDQSSVASWVQIIGVCAGFVYVGSVIKSSSRGVSRWPLAWIILIAGIVILIWFSQNRIIAIYLVGCVFLGSYFICSHSASAESISTFRPSWKAPSIITALITVVLLASPVTVSRIVISLPTLPVPSKFELHSDPGARLSHSASIGFPSHSLSPIDVQLSANNILIDEPMPWLHFQARRDTNFTIEQIQYNFLQTTIYQLKFDQLHEIGLAEKSDDVTLSGVDNGIVIENISAGESAWLKLPELAGRQLRSGARLKSTGIKVIVWLVICFAFFLWAPQRSRGNP